MPATQILPSSHFMNLTIQSFVYFIETVSIVTLILWIAHQIVIARRSDLGNERLFPRQLFMLALTIFGLVAIALALPVEPDIRNQIIPFIGLVISGMIAFASSTIFANMMAGIMLRVTKPFRTGDFIEVEPYFGRVVERGLLDTEIQTEQRQLVSLPNTLLVSKAISVTNTSGTIISTIFSLGYDVHHSQVETLLIQAAKQCELEDPFVQVLELGNFAITYKISGLLKEVKSLLTARSNLCRSVLDTLHQSGIEILSPSFMNQRQIPSDQSILPENLAKGPQKKKGNAEDLVFDKAEKAEQLEKLKEQTQQKIQTCKTKLETASEDEKNRIQERIKRLREELKELETKSIEFER